MRLFFLLSILLPCVVSAKELYEIQPFQQKVIIDGRPDDKVWAKIPYSEKLVPLNDKGEAHCGTRFKMYSDKDCLYILVALEGQKLSDLENLSDEEIPEKTPRFASDHITLFFSPQPELDDHYRISINFKNKRIDSFYPAMAGRRSLLGTSVDYKWNSQTVSAFSQVEDTIYLEISISVNQMRLDKNLFKGFGFNLVRTATYEEIAEPSKKIQRKKDISSWASVQGDIWDSQKFGLIKGPLGREKESFTKEHLVDLDQMTNGMTALLKSLDIYYKAVIGYNHHIPEGTEINGDIGNFDHVPLPQYTVKADGYYRFFQATKYEPYRELAEHILLKLYRGYSETKDVNGKNYLVWNNLMSKDGKVHAYDKGTKMGFFMGPSVLYNQSENVFHIKDVMFQDALGQGFIDLSEIKNLLSADMQEKCIEMLKGTLEFLHQPYALVDNGEEYYWRVDSWKPSEPKAYEGKLNKQDWQYLGQDIVLFFVALWNFNEASAKPFEESMLRFSAFYQSSRLGLSEQTGPHAIHNLYKLDRRMTTLAEFAQEKNIQSLLPLRQWLLKHLPSQYKEMPKVEYTTNGATRNSWSTQGVFEIYRFLGMKNEHEQFWSASFDDNMKPTGLYQGYRILPMNFSSYPLYFDFANRAYHAKVMSETKFIEVIQKMFSLYGNPKVHRDNLQFWRDLTPEQRTRPLWPNIPYDGYIEGVLPEGIYANASPQAFYSVFGKGNVDEFFKSRAERVRYEYLFRYYQYTAPFQYHSDRYSYGKAESFCLMSNQKSVLLKSELNSHKRCKVSVTTPDMPAGVPIFTTFDITDILFLEETGKKPTGLKVDKVFHNNVEVPFRSYQIFQYKRINSDKDKAKIVIGLWNPGPLQEVELEIQFKEKQFRQYFSLKDGSSMKDN